MSKRFNTQIRCPHCHEWHTNESEFSRWYRNNPALESRDGHVISDLDFIVHRYKTPEWDRMIQCLMFLEVKTMGADLEVSQRKTLSIYRQLNKNQHGGIVHPQVMDGPKGGLVQVRDHGGYLLRLSGTDPVNSQRMTWNGKRVNIRELERILRFDVDPYDFKKTDWRPNHHHPNHHHPDQTLPLFPKEAA